MPRAPRHARPLSVERIREVLASWPPDVREAATDDDLALAADYHRIIEIHQRAGEGGVRVARASMAARLESEDPPDAVADALPAGDALATRRLAGVREGRHETARAAMARLAAVEPQEEAAVASCRAEIEAALARRR